MSIFLSEIFSQLKKDESTRPTASESDGPYFEIMGQRPGPTINLKACTALVGKKLKYMFSDQ